MEQVIVHNNISKAVVVVVVVVVVAVLLLLLLLLLLFLGAFAKLRKATISFVMSVLRPSVYLSAWNNSAPTCRISLK